MLHRHIGLVLLLIAVGSTSAADPAGIEYFEKSVRPVLLENCASCHGVKKQSAGLRLDSVTGILKGADDGPVIVVGKPKESRLITAINHTTDVKMPEKKLPAETIAVLTAWVERGAPMPDEKAVVAKIDAKSHWAFQAVKEPVVPKDSGAVNEIDAFVLAQLKAKGLTLAPQADPRALICRIYIDMIGLPPTFEESEAFAKDPSLQAYERVVEKLLASPQYGERWARHWLDVARYADTKGYVFTEDRNFPYAFTYRDYVIRSFNEDKPYSQFVIEQIAADRLKLGEDNRALAALGYLTLGRRFNNNIHDIIDDRIEVVTRGFLGLSVGCARCHDHKFDPIPTADYYSLYGIFNSSVEPATLPLIGGKEKSKATLEFEAEVSKMDAAANAFYERMTQQALAKFRTEKALADYLLTATESKGQSAEKIATAVRDQGFNNIILSKWRKFLDSTRGKPDAIFAAWHAVAALKPDAFGKDYAVLKTKLLADSKSHNPLILDAICDLEPNKLADVAAAYGTVLARAVTDEKRSAAAKAIGDLLTGHAGPFVLSEPDVEAIVAVDVKKQYRTLRNAAQNLRATSPLSPPRAMVMEDKPKPTEPVVFLRGNPANRGPQVPRQFLISLSGEDRKPFNDGSGRLELANAIVSPMNPLTARVMVNRVWTWHFGQGLVRTPSDFGFRSDPPTHPELLDWLASKFTGEDAGSIKKLHRRILLSATYKQSTAITERALAADPDDSLLSRSPRRRLEFEPLRDSLLATAGLLDITAIGGRSEDIFKQPFSHRRSVYMFVERQNLPGTLRAFDLANPDQHSAQRYRTTVPQQALFLMNSPFAAEMARGVMKRPEVKAAANDNDRLTAVVRAVLHRNPTPGERGLMMEFLQQSPRGTEATLGPWEQLAQTLMMSNEFAYTD
ncbi:PSD1 and planctomycete cytochrome C domain-containing protein [soil metagenome]